MLQAARFSIAKLAQIAPFLMVVILLGAAVSARADEAGEAYESALESFSDGDLAAAWIYVRNALKADIKHTGVRLLQARIHLVAGNADAAEATLGQARRFNAKEADMLILLGETYIMQRRFDAVYDDLVPNVADSATSAKVYALRGLARLEQGQLHTAATELERSLRLLPDNPDALVTKAALLAREGDVVQAENVVELLTASHPDFAKGWHLKAELQRLRGDFDQALDSLARAIAANPFHLVARRLRSEILLSRNEVERATEDVEFTLKIRPLDVDANYLRAQIGERQNKPDEVNDALHLVRRGLDALGSEYVSRHPPSLFVSGLVHFRQGEFAQAREPLRRYVIAVPGNPVARKLLATLALRDGDFERAIELLEPVAKRMPNDAQVFALLGSAYLKKKDSVRASELLERAVELAPQHRDIRVQLALSRLMTGHERAAIDELESILKVDTESVEPARVIAMIHLRKNNFEAALEWADRIDERRPNGNFDSDGLRGAALVGLGRFDEARRTYERILQREPNHITARLNLAELALEQGDELAARELYKSVLGIESGHIKALVKLARLDVKAGSYDKAIAWFEKVRAAQPDAVENQIELLELYLRSKRPQDALVIAQTLNNRHPDHLKVLLALGRVRLALNQRDDARLTFTKMSRLAVYNTGELHRIAQYQFQSNDAEGAEWSLTKALQAEPRHVPSLVTLARLYVASRRMDDALVVVERLRREHPKLPISYSLAGEVYRAAGRIDDAIAAYSAGMLVAPESGLALGLFRTRFAASAETTKRNEALLDLAAWIRTEPRDIQALRTYGAALLELDRVDEAIEFHTKMLVAVPDDPGVLNALAYAYNEKGDAKAKEYAEKAHALAPQRPSVLDTYGWILTRQGQPAVALQFLRQALHLAPNSGEIEFHLGATLFELGRQKEAMAQLRSALSRSATFNGAKEAQALVDKITAKRSTD
ncbi:MAG: putative PEP-CTERM system TPR-repeat lipoprotein [Gammaproteobacteria bacterium]|jgi:putative PEP-CTERM system TPR-repeat lipoprotein